MLRQKQKALTLSLIRKAARDIFYSKPFDSVTMEEIAALSGVSRATVYLHFANKNELLLSVVSDTLADQFELYVTLAKLESVDRGVLLNWLKDYRSAYDKHRPVWYLFSIAFTLMPDNEILIKDHRESAIQILGKRYNGFSLEGLSQENRAKKHAEIYLLLFQIEQVVNNFSTGPNTPDIDIGLEILADRLLDFCS